MIDFIYPSGADQFDAAVFDQSGQWISSGHHEECELKAMEISGLYCIWARGKPIIRFDFENLD